MKQLTVDDLEKLSLGSAVLGSGGGGDPSYSLLMADYLLQQYGPVNLISVDELKEDDLVVPLSMMGAPLINMERILSGRESEVILTAIEDRYKRRPTVLMAAEIGGANAFTPLLAAAKWRLPLLDGDMIGRAFPELQMSSCNLKELAATPAFMGDCLGNSITIEATDANTLERIARSITVAMGSSSAVAFYLMTGSTAADSIVPGTFSLALTLGETILSARQTGTDPVTALLKVAGATLLGRGTLIDIDQSVAGGFLQGSASILDNNGKITISYQNEYLLAKRGADTMASTPDLIVLLEENSGTPLASEALRYGLQAVLVALPAPDIWRTEEGLKLVGPRRFGYEIDYCPIAFSQPINISGGTRE